MKKLSVVLMMLHSLAMGQSSGVLVGMITTASGEAYRKQKVTLVDERASERRQTTTDELGIFAFDLLPPGKYRRAAAHGQLRAGGGEQISLQVDEKRSVRLVWQPVNE